MATAVITEDEIRSFMMDKPELNPLISGVKWDSKDIDRAIVTAIDYYNNSPPFIGRGYTVENFPYRYALLIGVTGLLLRGAAVNQAINQLDYAVDGVHVNDYDKAQLFMSLGNAFWEEYKQMVTSIKIGTNISNAFGRVGSEYKYRAR